MKRYISVFVAVLFVVFVAQAQRVRFNIAFTPSATSDMKVYAQPLNAESDGNSVPLRFKDGAFVGGVPVSDTGFYNIVVVQDGMQFINPVYATDAKNISLDAVIEGKSMVFTDTPDNRALSAVNEKLIALDRRLWLERGLDSEALKSVIQGYGKTVESVVSTEGLADAVCEYIKVWAYTRAHNAYNSIPRAQEIDAAAVPFAKYDVLPQPGAVLDNKYASLFVAAFLIIGESISDNNGLIDKLGDLYVKYNDEAVRRKVSASLMSRFISDYDYSRDFDGGLAIVKEAVEKYGVSQKYVETYLKHKSAVVGSPLPADIVLVDAKGNRVSLDAYKGKYLYIDLWASWCGPCCREVPYLKALEKELKNKDVVFVSVSSDTDEAAWKNKMTELDMHGIQLLDKDNTLGTALNVRGIPFFVIYDKEGKLHTYGAMRPSRGAELRNFLEELK